MPQTKTSPSNNDDDILDMPTLQSGAASAPDTSDILDMPQSQAAPPQADSTVWGPRAEIANAMNFGLLPELTADYVAGKQVLGQMISGESGQNLSDLITGKKNPGFLERRALYKDYLQSERKNYLTAHPYESTAIDVGAGIPTAVMGGGLVGDAANAAVKAVAPAGRLVNFLTGEVASGAPWYERLGSAALRGSAGAAAQSAANSQMNPDMSVGDQAEIGAMIGAPFGAAGAALKNLIRLPDTKVSQTIKDWFTQQGPNGPELVSNVDPNALPYAGQLAKNPKVVNTFNLSTTGDALENQNKALYTELMKQASPDWVAANPGTEFNGKNVEAIRKAVGNDMDAAWNSSQPFVMNEPLMQKIEARIQDAMQNDVMAGTPEYRKLDATLKQLQNGFKPQLSIVGNNIQRVGFDPVTGSEVQSSITGKSGVNGLINSGNGPLSSVGRDIKDMLVNWGGEAIKPPPLPSGATPQQILTHQAQQKVYDDFMTSRARYKNASVLQTIMDKQGELGGALDPSKVSSAVAAHYNDKIPEDLPIGTLAHAADMIEHAPSVQGSITPGQPNTGSYLRRLSGGVESGVGAHIGDATKIGVVAGAAANAAPIFINTLGPTGTAMTALAGAGALTGITKAYHNYMNRLLTSSATREEMLGLLQRSAKPEPTFTQNVIKRAKTIPQNMLLRAATMQSRDSQ